MFPLPASIKQEHLAFSFALPLWGHPGQQWLISLICCELMQQEENAFDTKPPPPPAPPAEADESSQPLGGKGKPGNGTGKGGKVTTKRFCQCTLCEVEREVS